MDIMPKRITLTNSQSKLSNDINNVNIMIIIRRRKGVSLEGGRGEN